MSLRAIISLFLEIISMEIIRDRKLRKFLNRQRKTQKKKRYLFLLRKKKCSLHLKVKPSGKHHRNNRNSNQFNSQWKIIFSERSQKRNKNNPLTWSKHTLSRSLIAHGQLMTNQDKEWLLHLNMEIIYLDDCKRIKYYH